MADAYWRYGDGRTAASVTLHPAAAAAAAAPPASQQIPQVLPAKRARADFPPGTEVPSHPQYPGYPPRVDQGVGQVGIRDTDTLEASYDHYLRNGAPYGTAYGAGEAARPISGGMPQPHPVDDRMGMGVVGLGDTQVGFGSNIPDLSRRPEMPLPPDASNTLYVEGLPANCTRREVSHIFRPFVGFREVRLVNKGPRIHGGDPLVLCFVDFSNPSQAAIALDALQGYKFDEHEQDSSSLRLQFARFPGPRSGGGARGGRR